MEDPGLTSIMMLRMLERVLAVTIGGIAIYFGYRLFALLPTQSDSAGKIELPGVSVVLSKVGPGVFFAAFGSFVLFKALQPVVIGNNFIGATPLEPLPLESPTGESKRPEHSATPQERERVRQSLQTLNCMELIVTAPRTGIRPDDVEGPVRDAKVALLESIWNQAGWGDSKVFRRWAVSREGDIPDQLRKLYFSVLPGCPK